MDFALLFFCFFTISAVLVVYYSGNNNAICHSRVPNNLLLYLYVIPLFFYGLLYLGFRPLTAGTDTPGYVFAYMHLTGIVDAYENGVAYYGNTEYLWWLFSGFLSYFFDAGQWLAVLYVISFAALYFGYVLFLKGHDISPYIFAFALMTYYFVYLGNGIRQSLAIPFSLMALGFFYKKNYSMSCLMNFLAIGFHWSVGLFLGMVFFEIRFFNRKIVFLLIPVAAFLLSWAFDGFFDSLVESLGMQSLSEKRDLYFADGRVSHIDAVWKTANFWVCLFISFGYLIFVPVSDGGDNRFHKFFCYFISIILISINNVDFSERYMPVVLAALPIGVFGILNSFNIRPFVKNSIFLMFFIAMAIGVYLNESTQITLGFGAGINDW